MRMHLFEFRSDNKKLTCTCGWARTLKTTDLKAAYARFAKHCAE